MAVLYLLQVIMPMTGKLIVRDHLNSDSTLPVAIYLLTDNWPRRKDMV
jgi:hypothetical protein